jgi:RNA polymerase sigma-70 factor, ECF subfamily
VDASIPIRIPNLTRPTKEADHSSSSFHLHSIELAVSDESLISQVCLGSKEALANLFKRHARLVRHIAIGVLKDASEAEDLVQDIFVLIHRFCRTFDSSKGSARFWMMQLTYRRAVSRRRYLNSRHFYTRLALDDEGSEQSDDLVNRLLAELDLQKLFGTLSEDQQRTLRLHFIEGYTLDEIAKMLGQTKGNVRHHSFRGLERLRKLVFAGKLPDGRAV